MRQKQTINWTISIGDAVKTFLMFLGVLATMWTMSLVYLSWIN